MPIVGLTDRPAQFPCIGTLRKGAPKPDRGPGRDLDHFRFDSDDPRAMEMFATAYGTEPRAVTVYLPYSSIDENFSAWQESWTASKLNHRCDGETCYTHDSNGALVSNGQPCPSLKPAKDDRNRCKQIGRLMVIIPELARFAYVTVLTSSIHDIIAISQQLAAIQAMRGTLQGVPMVISRNEREISMPKPDGSRVRVKKWMLQIEVSPEWAALQLAAMRRDALQLASPLPIKALPAPTRIVDIDTGEIHEDEDDGDAQYNAAMDAAEAAQPAMSAALRARSIAKIQDALRREKDPPGTDLALDFDAMSDAELISNGKRIIDRVA